MTDTILSRDVRAYTNYIYLCTMTDTILSTCEHRELLRRTKEMSQYGRSTSNYGTCKERLMRYMIIMHMSPYDTYGSM